MSLLCTSFPLDPRRIARSRAARVLVWVLALALSLTNAAAAAMPLQTGLAAAATGSHQSSRAHCASHAASTAHAIHPGHSDGCACCIGKTCACVPVCDVPAIVVSYATAAPSDRLFCVLPPRPCAAIEAPPLRPPIA